MSIVVLSRCMESHSCWEDMLIQPSCIHMINLHLCYLCWFTVHFAVRKPHQSPQHVTGWIQEHLNRPFSVRCNAVLTRVKWACPEICDWFQSSMMLLILERFAPWMWQPAIGIFGHAHFTSQRLKTTMAHLPLSSLAGETCWKALGKPSKLV